jgi:hypothetical protein
MFVHWHRFQIWLVELGAAHLIVVAMQKHQSSARFYEMSCFALANLLAKMTTKVSVWLLS